MLLRIYSPQSARQRTAEYAAAQQKGENMRKSNDTIPNAFRRPFAALMAAMLAVAMAFMAFDANTLRLAFADEGVGQAAEQPEAVGEEGDEPDEDNYDGDQAALPETNGGDEQPEGDQLEEAAEPDSSTDANGASARDGPTDDVQQESTRESDAASGTDVEPGNQPDEPAAQALESASCVVTFYSDAAANGPSILARKYVSAEEGQVAVVTVSDVRADAPTGVQQFNGWLYNGQTYADQITIDPQDGDVSLYPSFASGHWIRFVSGDADANATYVPSLFVAADAAELGSLPTTSREGYAFEGWFTASWNGDNIAYADQVTDGQGQVLNPQALAESLAQADLEMHAKWRGVETEYRVITWHENPDDDNYSYQGFYTVGDDEGETAVSGEMTDVADAQEFPGFTLADFEQKSIKGDGSTVVNLYYDRNEYSIVFHQGRTDKSPVFEELTITAKYGEDIHDDWPKASESNGAYTSAWYTLPEEDSGVFVTGVGTMPLGGAHYYLKTDEGIDCNLVFRVQDVNGSNNFTDYVSQPFSSEKSPITTADDYKPIKGFMVNAASAEDAAAIRDIAAGDKAATYDSLFEVSAKVGARFSEAPEVTEDGDVPRHTLYAYYLRCQYDVVFEENGGPEAANVEDVFYEASLAGKAPENYVVGETTYEANDGESYTFEGWYADETLEGTQFDFETATMPANNVVLYAKWVPTKHLVQVDPAGGTFANPSQSTYFYVEHGGTVGDIQVERHYVADENGDYVYTYETEQSDPDSDGYGVAAYEPAEDGMSGDRYRYEPGIYSLYGWYRAGETALANEPFDFSEPITEDTSIIAEWRSAGVFDIAYDASVEVDGDFVNADIDTMLDAGYADLSPTYIMNTPEDIVSESGDEYVFAGWQVVEGFESGDGALADELYLEGDAFLVDSDLARNNTIHLQAVYESVEDPSDEPAEPADPIVPADPADPAGPADPVDPTSPVGPSGAGAVQPAPSTSLVDTAAESGLLPKTGDMAQVLAMAIGGIALLAFAVAMFARAIRRGVASIHIDQHDSNA